MKIEITDGDKNNQNSIKPEPTIKNEANNQKSQEVVNNPYKTEQRVREDLQSVRDSARESMSSLFENVINPYGKVVLNRVKNIKDKIDESLDTAKTNCIEDKKSKIPEQSWKDETLLDIKDRIKSRVDNMNWEDTLRLVEFIGKLEKK
jgi:hypothetical protein